MSRAGELSAAALAPLRGDPDPACAVRVARARPEELHRFLADERLCLLWAESLQRLETWAAIPPALRSRIEGGRIAATARVLAQEQAAREITSILAARGIAHAFLKGTHLRRELYAHPALRAADDVDLLVPKAARTAATKALEGAGFSPRPARHPETHAASLCRDAVDVDLHWHPFRPGRTRFDPGPAMLDTRVVTGPLPVLDDLSTSLLLTVGAALGDYVTGRVLRAVELDLWIRRGRLPWDELMALTRRLGVATAAWAMLTWTRDCLGTPLPGRFLARLAPGGARRAYLRAFISLDPPRVHDLSPVLARAAFSLVLEDTVNDAVRAVLAHLRGRGTDLAADGDVCSPVGAPSR